MRKTMIALGTALLLAPAAASAQSAAENFSYREPSGMFGEGHAKWQLYKFMHEDRERREHLQPGLATGSVGPASPAVPPRSERGFRRTR
ncbi:hypothetical protein [Enterovirga aerilata]|uniref:Uncharacterized protein n=1 Tax=Enterovirga aerilata TaxID=2730920 RepID=A0A849IDZ6_9HYPH|nr:hypothetical protein [Enterovirga sp. DB1703]NNM74445.1 hypothetical protein [Enterovirga sp. DB1703]